MRGKALFFKVPRGIFFLSLLFILSCSGWTAEKESGTEEEARSRLSLLIGTLYAREEGITGYRGGLSYVMDGTTAEVDICFSPGDQRGYSARFALEGKVQEPQVEGEVSVYLTWWWREVDEERRRENRVYSLFVGEKLRFPYQTYLYADLGIAYPQRENLLWGWGVRLGWEMGPGTGISAQYGRFVADEDTMLSYSQRTIKGELQYGFGENLLLFGYERSSVDDPFYLLNMHLPEVWYVCLKMYL